MKRNYTLNRFYDKAKALIENNNCTDPECILRVQFEIIEDSEKRGSPRLDCIICYEKDHSYVFFASRSTPEAALLVLEEKILESKENWPTPQIASINLTEEHLQTIRNEDND